MMALDRDKMPDALRKRVNAAIVSQDKNANPYVDKKAKAPAKKSNRRNVRTESLIIGRTFDSKHECRVAEILWADQLAGKISELTFQVKVRLLGAFNMVPDFRYVQDGILWHCEAKGSGFMANETRWKQQVAVWSVAGPTPYRVVYSGRKPDDLIYPCPNDTMKQLSLDYLIRDYGRRMSIGAARAMLGDES